MKRGRILFPSNFDDKGNVEVVKKSLLRLENKKFLVRLAHGIYLYPKQDKLLGSFMSYNRRNCSCNCRTR